MILHNAGVFNDKNDEMMIPRSVGVHDGHFHADEVTACALLVLYHCVDGDKIIRSRDPLMLAQCQYVCDVGGVYDPEQRKFDHHQMSYQGTLSSAGMVLLYLQTEGLLSESEYHFFEHNLIKGVDAHDNGCFLKEDYVCTFSHVIASFNPTSYQSLPQQYEAGFREAFHFCLAHLYRLQKRYYYEQECTTIVQKTMETSTTCLIFDHPLVWLEPFFALGGERHPALFVIMPTEHQWKLRGIPPTLQQRTEVRLPFPQAWAGLMEDELVRVSHIPGAVFCHKGRFISVWETKESALQALQYVLQQEGKIHENSI